MTNLRVGALGASFDLRNNAAACGKVPLHSIRDAPRLSDGRITVCVAVRGSQRPDHALRVLVVKIGNRREVSSRPRGLQLPSAPQRYRRTDPLRSAASTVTVMARLSYEIRYITTMLGDRLS